MCLMCCVKIIVMSKSHHLYYRYSPKYSVNRRAAVIPAASPFLRTSFPLRYLLGSRPGRMSDFSLYYQNVRGLRGKTTTFQNNLIFFDPSCTAIALTETWLNSSVHSSELLDCTKTRPSNSRRLPRRQCLVCMQPLPQFQTLMGEDL
jgi:hypothetical protein